MRRAFVGVGTNVDRDRNLRSGLAAMTERFGALTLSRVFECAAVGFSGDDFLNLVVAFDTPESPAQLAEGLRAIERAHGRPERVPKYSPRTLDLDLLMLGDCVQHDVAPELPREDVLRYAFVLWPLAEMVPGLPHPELGVGFAELWARFPREGMPALRPVPFAWQAPCHA